MHVRPPEAAFFRGSGAPQVSFADAVGRYISRHAQSHGIAVRALGIPPSTAKTKTAVRRFFRTGKECCYPNSSALRKMLHIARHRGDVSIRTRDAHVL